VRRWWAATEGIRYIVFATLVGVVAVALMAAIR
jgi:hypothetical protein